MSWRVEIHYDWRRPYRHSGSRVEAHAVFWTATDDPKVTLARLYHSCGSVWLTWAPVKEVAADRA